MKKIAIVFGGGGSKGAYELGVWKALDELGITADIAVGTSIGAMMAALYVQKSYKEASDLWDQLMNHKVMYLEGVDEIDIESMMSDPLSHKQELQSYIKSKGIQIDPLKKIVDNLYQPELFFSSSIDFGLVTTQVQGKDKFFTQIDKIKQDLKASEVKDYILASASAFPIFPIYQIEDNNYIDGGYSDNIPVALAKKLGATHCIVVELAGGEHPPIQRENEVRIRPHQSLGPFLDFSQDKIQKNKRWGYLDAMKAYGKYFGYTYTFHDSQHRVARAFDQRIFDDGIDLKKYEDYAYPYLQVLESIAYECEVDHLQIYDILPFIQLVKKAADTKYLPLLASLKMNDYQEMLNNAKNKSMQFIIAYYLYDLKRNGKMPSWFEKLIPHIPSETLAISVVLWNLNQIVEENLHL